MKSPPWLVLPRMPAVSHESEPDVTLAEGTPISGRLRGRWWRFLFLLVSFSHIADHQLITDPAPGLGPNISPNVCQDGRGRVAPAPPAALATIVSILVERP
jgi:hypothetical protein